MGSVLLKGGSRGEVGYESEEELGADKTAKAHSLVTGFNAVETKVDVKAPTDPTCTRIFNRPTQSRSGMENA